MWSNNRRSCRCQNLRVKQKSIKNQLGKGQSRPPRPPTPTSWIGHRFSIFDKDLPNSWHGTLIKVAKKLLPWIYWNDKIKASLQKCLQGVVVIGCKQTTLTSKMIQSYSFSKTHIKIRFNPIHFCPWVPSLVFVVLLKYPFNVIRGYFHISLNFVIIFFCLNLVKTRDTVPVIPCSSKFSFALAVVVS